MVLSPLPAVIYHPWFIADISGWHNNGVTEDENFLTIVFISKIQSETKSLHRNPLLQFQTLRNSGKILVFQSAFHFKDIYEKFVKAHCLLVQTEATQLDAALHQ